MLYGGCKTGVPTQGAERSVWAKKCLCFEVKMAASKTNASEWFPGAAERDKRDRPAGLGGWVDRAAGTQGGLGGKSDGLLKHWEPSAKSWRLTALT